MKEDDDIYYRIENQHGCEWRLPALRRDFEANSSTSMGSSCVVGDKIEKQKKVNRGSDCSLEEYIVLAQELIAAKAHLAGRKEAKENVLEVSSKFNANPFPSGAVNWMSLRDRFRRIVFAQEKRADGSDGCAIEERVCHG